MGKSVTPGQVAYVAFYEALLNNDPNSFMPSWESNSQSVRDAWECAAIAGSHASKVLR